MMRTDRGAGLAAMAMILALAGASPVLAGQVKPQYPIKKDDKPEKPVKLPQSSTTPEKDEPGESGWDEARKKSMEIGTQPVRDVGLSKREIPPILVKAQSDPYSLNGLKTCKALAAEVTSLNEVLGEDYTVGNELKENKAGKLAEAGGKSVVNAIIPFRGIVRELSGAAPADRRMNAAVDAGLARRGFLRGVHANRKCRTAF